MDILKRASVLFIFLIVSCNLNNDIKDVKRIKEMSVKVVTLETYNFLFSQMTDSIKNWKLNNLQKYIEDKRISEYELDSLICFNGKGNRCITCLLERAFLKPNTTAGITFFYGEKINNEWFFFSGEHIFIPHEMKEEKDDNPFDYPELHQIALKEVYGGYLKSNGEINEEWFTLHFENAGWCSNCKTKEDFQKSRLEDVKTLWLQRDTTQPIKQLPAKEINS